MNAETLNVPRFNRPRGRTWGKLNEGLGPLPADMPDLRESEDIDWAEVPSYTMRAQFAVVGVVVTIVYALWYSFDWMRHSAVSAGLMLLPISKETQGMILQLVIVSYVALLIWRLRRRKGKGGSSEKPHGFMRAAIFEEQWFRSGCETWSWKRRVYSCVFFGIIHLWNLVVPVAAAVALMLGGAVMMTVYLQQYRKSGSMVSATLVSSRFHRDYNETVLFIVLPLAMIGMMAYRMALHWMF